MQTLKVRYTVDQRVHKESISNHTEEYVARKVGTEMMTKLAQSLAESKTVEVTEHHSELTHEYIIEMQAFVMNATVYRKLMQILVKMNDKDPLVRDMLRLLEIRK